MRKRDNDGLGDVVASTISVVIVAVGSYGLRYHRLTKKLKRTQVRNHDYQSRLQALPGDLTALDFQLGPIKDYSLSPALPAVG